MRDKNHSSSAAVSPIAFIPMRPGRDRFDLMQATVAEVQCHQTIVDTVGIADTFSVVQYIYTMTSTHVGFHIVWSSIPLHHLMYIHTSTQGRRGAVRPILPISPVRVAIVSTVIAIAVTGMSIVASAIAVRVSVPCTTGDGDTARCGSEEE